MMKLKPAATLDIHAPGFSAVLKKHKISGAEFEKVLKILGRAPTFAELGVFSAMWSEHCSYKSSRVHLKRLKTTGDHVVVGPGENAGVVRLHGKLCVAFKMESHNHPSYLEPFHGAATGVGGILRDVFCMGARPFAILNCLRFGERSHPKTPYLLERVTSGIGFYGNCMGIPTVGGNTAFHASYNGNCLVNAMACGFIEEDKIFKGYASGEGNLVVYVGSATGRDGIHGATMASDSFQSQSSEDRGAVQVGDPFAQKLLLEVTLAALEQKLVVGLQDMGAAGLTSSSVEMADRAGTGIEIDLDKIPVRAKSMSAYELLLSESQERMLMVVEPHKWEELTELLSHWELPFAIIGKVTATGRFQAHYRGVLEVDMPVAELANEAPKYARPQTPKQSVRHFAKAHQAADETLRAELFQRGNPFPIFNRYDHHIGTRTVLGPESGGAAVLWVRSEITSDHPYLGVTLSSACDEDLCAEDPYWGAASTVMSAARMIFATGGTPLALTDCLNFGNPENPEVMHQFAQAIDGMNAACTALDLPIVSGNVSLYNESDGESIFPTPMVGMVGKHEDVRQAVPAVTRGSGTLWLLAPKTDRKDLTLDFDAEKAAAVFLHKGIMENHIRACRDVRHGGWLTCAAKMVIGGEGGFSVRTGDAPSPFQRLSAAYIFLAGETLDTGFAKTAPASHQLIKVGTMTQEPGFFCDENNMDFNSLKTAFEESFRPDAW